MNDKWLPWEPEKYESHFLEHSIEEGDKIGWDGLILDGWKEYGRSYRRILVTSEVRRQRLELAI